MKHLLLLCLVIPFALNARREDPRIPKTAPYDGVKSVEAKYIFVIPKGNDTAITETFSYNEAGLLEAYNYEQHMMKTPHYRTSSVYQYLSKDAWVQTIYKNKKTTDSIIVRDGWANWYNYRDEKLYALHEYRGDSAREIVFKGGDTIVRPNRLANLSFDPFWDYYNAGNFSSKTTTRSVDSDTTRYFNSAGECLVMVINFYDSNFKPVRTDYYNFKVKRFDLFYLPYSERMYMTFFLNKSRKGNWSYEITRKYNEKGWLIEEYLTDARPYKGSNGTPLLKLYTYTTY